MHIASTCNRMSLYFLQRNAVTYTQVKRSLAYQGHSISEVGLYEISFGTFQLFLKQKKSYQMNYCFSISADHQDGE